MKLAFCPAWTCPTSASSIETRNCICGRSSAITNSVATLNEAATVWPGSTCRDSTTPETGETMIARRRLVSALDSCAWAEVTLACAGREPPPCRARRWPGRFPSRSSRAPCRPKGARRPAAAPSCAVSSVSVACDWASEARADCRPARCCLIWSSITSVLTRARHLPAARPGRSHRHRPHRSCPRLPSRHRPGWSAADCRSR